jgi:phage tail tape-measure protein
MTEDGAKKDREENEKTAKIAGAGAGVVAGAQVGTVLLPIPIVGTFTGALVGGIVGSKIGKKVGGKIMDTLSGGSEKSAAASSAGKPDLTKELQRLAELKAQGVLDEDEFKAAKAKLLGL